MSSLPPPPPWAAIPQPLPPPPPGNRDTTNAIRLLVIVAVVFVAGVGIAVFERGRDDGYPDEWDERVTDLVAFVEEERGHEFSHPVPIDFLTAEEYSAATRTDSSEFDAAAVRDAEQSEGQLRALGLVHGDVDLLESGNDLTDTGTLAFYDPATERITVRGTEVDAGLAVTLVHELTHVLQDQVFGLEDLFLIRDDTSGESFALRALIEGDAVRIENRYIEAEVSDEELEEIQGTTDADLEAIDEEGIPEALQAFFALPYALGEGFVSVLEADGGDAAIDDAFRDPPATEEHLADPLSYLDGDDAADVPVPDPGEGDDIVVLGNDEFGAASTFLVLAQRIPALQALDAALGWGGDAYVDFQRDGRACVLLDIVGDEASDTAELRVAFDAWAAASPAGAATVSEVDGRVRFEACDPGVDAEPPAGSAFASLALLATRNLVIADAFDGGLDEEFAVCYSRAILTGFTLEELSSQDVPADIDARLQAAAESCG